MPPPVEIWLSDLDRAVEFADRYRPFLSHDELERAQRFRFDHLRQRYIFGRGVVRAILGLRTGCDPAAIRFHYAENGKPSIIGESGWHFNVSHSKSLLACAVTAAGPIGVDVECVRPMKDALAIAERYFSLPERRRLQDIAPEHRKRAFF